MHHAPLWVKVLVIVAIIASVGFVIVHFTGGGFGPGSHTAP